MRGRICVWVPLAQDTFLTPIVRVITLGNNLKQKALINVLATEILLSVRNEKLTTVILKHHMNSQLRPLMSIVIYIRIGTESLGLISNLVILSTHTHTHKNQTNLVMDFYECDLPCI